MKLPQDLPDHHDAELILKAYELRREAVMREARHALTTSYWPKTAEEAIAPNAQDHPLNPAWRQVIGYWEMIFGMARHGMAWLGWARRGAVWLGTAGQGVAGRGQVWHGVAG